LPILLEEELVDFMEKKEPFVSVITVNWNRKKDLLELLADLEKQTYPKLKIIVIDNGSTDGSINAVKRKFPKVKIIALQKNIGLHAGFNKGVKIAKGIIFGTDNDCRILDKNFFSHLIKKFKNKDVNIIACSIKDFYSKKLTWDNPHHSFSGDLKNGYDCVRFTGAGFALHKRIFNEIGDFNEDFFIYHGELEFSLKCIDAGYTCRYFPDLIVLKKASSISRSTGLREFYSTRNFFWWCWLYLPFQYLALRMFGFRNLLANFLRNEAREADVKGILCAITKLPWVIRDRKPLQHSTIKKFFDSFNNYTNKF